MSTHPARTGRWELADVVRAHAEDLDGLSPEQRRVLQAIAQCRTAALGGHRRQCEACGHEALSYHLYHPHLHCIVPGGGRDIDDTRWVPTRRDFFLPVRVLAEVFRGKLLRLFEHALDHKKIRGPDGDARRPLTQAARKTWVV